MSFEWRYAANAPPRKARFEANTQAATLAVELANEAIAPPLFAEFELIVQFDAATFELLCAKIAPPESA